MFLTFSDLNEDRRAGEGTLSSPSISEFILLGLSSGFHHVVFRFSHYPSVLGNSKKKKINRPHDPAHRPKTASVAAALFLPWLAPASAMPFHPQCSWPVPRGRGGRGVGLSPGLQPAAGSGQTAACRVHRPH